MEFGSDDLRPFSGVDRPDNGGGGGGEDASSSAPRPLTAMSTEERQFSEAVRPMTGGGGAAGGRPQTGMRPPSGFVVANAAAAAVPGRPKTSRSRVGTAVGARQQEQQVDRRGTACSALENELIFPNCFFQSWRWKHNFSFLAACKKNIPVVFQFVGMDGARPFSRVGSAVGDRPGSTVLGRPMTSGSGAAGGGRVGTARGVPGTASRLVATAMQNRPASRGGGGNEANLNLLILTFFL